MRHKRHSLPLNADLSVLGLCSNWGLKLEAQGFGESLGPIAFKINCSTSSPYSVPRGDQGYTNGWRPTRNLTDNQKNISMPNVSRWRPNALQIGPQICVNALWTPSGSMFPKSRWNGIAPKSPLAFTKQQLSLGPGYPPNFQNTSNIQPQMHEILNETPQKSDQQKHNEKCPSRAKQIPHRSSTCGPLGCFTAARFSFRTTDGSQHIATS